MKRDLTLDVGCGIRPHGDIDCDLYSEGTIHREAHKDERIPVHSIPNFVKADCNNLPFRSETFAKVFLYHVLEHKGVNVVKTIQELTRVCHGIVEIKVPHILSPYHTYSHAHDKLFRSRHFHKLLGRYSYTITWTKWSWLKIWGRLLLPLINVPYEITIRIDLRLKNEVLSSATSS